MYNFEKAEQTTLAWLAGMLQSEGTFKLDRRVRSLSNDPEYTPPPPVPSVKIEMVEKDLMQYIADLVEQKLLKQNRQTVAGNAVYRVNVTSRRKVEALLRAIFPYIIGEKSRQKIQELLDVCDAYNNWNQGGGRSSAGRLAARIGFQQRVQAEQDVFNTQNQASQSNEDSADS